MSVEFIKKEVYYYKGFKPTDDEAEEILFFYNQSRSDLSEIVSDYYGC